MSKEAKDSETKPSSGQAPPVIPGVTQVKCKASFSLLPNNLIAGARHLAYIHRNEVYLLENQSSTLAMERADTTKCVYTEKDPISCIQFVKLSSFAGQEILVLITQLGLVHIYDSIGAKLLHSHKLQKSQVALSTRDAHLRGITDDGKETIYIGSGSGEILLFNCTPKALQLTKKIEASKESITNLFYRDQLLAVVDEVGTLVTFNVAANGVELSKVATGDSATSLPATVVSIQHGVIVVADVGGELRCYSATNKNPLLCKIAAAARTINAIEWHSASEKIVLVVVAEDSYASAWDLSAVSDAAKKGGGMAAGGVKHVWSLSPTASLLTGVKFAGDAKKQLVVTAYDSRYLYVMAPKELF